MAGAQRRRAARGGHEASFDAGSGSSTTFVELMHNEAVCAFVLAQLGPRCDRGRLRSCCTALRDHVDRVTDKIRVEEQHAEALADSGLLARLPCVRDVTFSAGPCQSLPLTKLLLALPAQTVKSFKMISSFSEQLLLPARFIATIIRFTGLTSLALQSKTKLEEEDLLLLGTMTQLRALTLSEVAPSSAVNVGDLRGLTQLTDFMFTFDHLSRANPVVAWGALLPHLALLEECKINAASLDALLMLGALPKLQHIGLRTHLDAAVAGAMDATRLPVATFPALASLTLILHDIDASDAPKLQQALSRMAALTKLIFWFIGNGACCCLPAVLQLTSLRSLSMYTRMFGGHLAAELNDAFLVQLARSLTRLETLQIVVRAGGHCASDAGFIAAAAHFKRLRRIKFLQQDVDDSDVAGGQRLVTASSALSLAAHCPSLTKVEFGGGAIEQSYLEHGAQLLEPRGPGREQGCEVRFLLASS